MDNILKEIDNYYTTKIEQFGATPQGVDWNSEASQTVRFEVLSKVIQDETHFSMLDFGCGFGSMYDYFKSNYPAFQYLGFDISEKMIQSALVKYNVENAKFTTILPIEKRDYVVASGIFNVRLENSEEDWLAYIIETLKTINNLSIKGFSFNVLTKYSDAAFMKEYLYYADPLFLFNYCKKHFSNNVALLHDYTLYEFTIIVRK